ncbi:uncharacterized protein [Dermacentor albipictus]|uniref:uncharacterized protein isoform X2 n=1 Tax=Dermacentor albipictus TaxID=60249 RepID=UPI0038FCD4FF
MSTSKDGDFAIVKFPDEGDAVAVVRRSWIRGGMCMWPQKAKNVQEMVRSCTEPGSGWIQTTCVVLGMYDNYKEARNKLSKAELTSNLDTDPDEPRRRKKKRQFDSSSDESVEPYSLPTPPTPPRMPFAACELLSDSQEESLPCSAGASTAMWVKQPKKQPLVKRRKGPLTQISAATGSKASPRHCTAPAGTLRHSSQSNEVAKESTRRKDMTPAPKCDQSALQPELLRLLHGIRYRQLEHSSQLNFLTSWVRSRMNNLDDDVDDIEVPQNLDAFLEFDDSLKGSATMKKQLKTRWKKLGGTGIVDATRRVLKDLLSDHVAMHYSWQGGKGKRHFRETACCEVMLDVLTSGTTCDGTVAEIEKVTKSWLRHAKERMERKAVKHPDNGRTNDEAALPTDLGEASIMEETSHRLLDIEADNDDSDL